ncbi:MAG: hypothetical protein HQ506_09010 [Candidatus Marinimicrobia bacterium]|nr:hypothetical protein [Candidatus Neomarinimicrobiota bacterium]
MNTLKIQFAPRYALSMRICLFTLLSVAFLTTLWGDEKDKSRDVAPSRLSRPSDITDRAAGTHNASNIGLFFENRGKLYPRRLSDGPSGEFPINSGRHYIYRINPMVGIAPDAASGRPANVIQGRYTQNEEWEATGGDHNPNFAKVAFSDQPHTWPADGWPIKDANGEAIIKSSQDSYCVYDDDNNTVEKLGIQVEQTGYAFGLAYAEDLLFFTYELTNDSETAYDSVYFALYLDFDVGNISGGINEYGDDIMGFDELNDFVTSHDATHYSEEWGGNTGIMGVTLLESPQLNGEMAGITDVHYNRYDNDVDDDSLQMVIVSSNRDYMPANYRLEDYTHPGGTNNLHYDDFSLINPSGEDLVVTFSSGPFNLAPGDTLRFVTCIVAGVDEADLALNLSEAQKLYAIDFQTPKPPPTPTLHGVAGDNRITLYWNNEVEGITDQISGALDFEGYNLYRSLDRGISWDQMDRNFNPTLGPDPIPLASFDRLNGIGADLGMSYSFTDESAINGFEYWYSLTAFDQGDSAIISLESAIGNTTDSPNTLSLIPLTAASDYVAAAIHESAHIGPGISNYLLDVNPLSVNALSDYSYEVTFDYSCRSEVGNAGVVAIPVFIDSSITGTDHYGINFVPDDRFDLVNLTTGEAIRSYAFRLERQWTLGPGLKVEFAYADTVNPPEPGDRLALNFSINLDRISGTDTSRVMDAEKWSSGNPLVSHDGLQIALDPQPEIQALTIAPVLGLGVDVSVINSAALLDTSYQIHITGPINPGADSLSYEIMVYDENLVAFIPPDTLFDQAEISFNGVSALITIDTENPPSPGLLATLSTLKAVAPNVLDRYVFDVADATTESSLIQDALDLIKVVPNPYVVGSLWEPEFGELRKEPLRQIQFIHLPSSCEIYIFTLAGDLIKTISHESFSGTQTWDLRAEGGREIAAGIYLYQVRGENFQYFNRFAVIK